MYRYAVPISVLISVGGDEVGYESGTVRPGFYFLAANPTSTDTSSGTDDCEVGYESGTVRPGFYFLAANPTSTDTSSGTDDCG
jgi:hypothetical protein